MDYFRYITDVTFLGEEPWSIWRVTCPNFYFGVIIIFPYGIYSSTVSYIWHECLVLKTLYNVLIGCMYTPRKFLGMIFKFMLLDGFLVLRNECYL